MNNRIDKMAKKQISSSEKFARKQVAIGMVGTIAGLALLPAMPLLAAPLVILSAANVMKGAYDIEAIGNAEAEDNKANASNPQMPKSNKKQDEVISPESFNPNDKGHVKFLQGVLKDKKTRERGLELIRDMKPEKRAYILHHEIGNSSLQDDVAQVNFQLLNPNGPEVNTVAASSEKSSLNKVALGLSASEVGLGTVGAIAGVALLPVMPLAAIPLITASTLAILHGANRILEIAGAAIKNNRANSGKPQMPASSKKQKEVISPKSFNPNDNGHVKFLNKILKNKKTRQRGLTLIKNMGPKKRADILHHKIGSKSLRNDVSQVNLQSFYQNKGSMTTTASKPASQRVTLDKPNKSTRNSYKP